MDFNLATLSLSALAGLLSFLSPCVLPLLPAYLSYLGGTSVAAIQNPGDRPERGRLASGSLLFVAGLATTFTLFGATATTLGRVLLDYQPLIAQVSGVVIVVLGLQMLGMFRLPFVDRYVKPLDRPASGPGGAYLMGAAFGVGWSPCIGPFLAGVLTLASQETTVWQGMALLAAYSLGLGAPFVLSGLAVDRALQFLGNVRPKMALITRVGGAVLIVMGVLVFSGQMFWLTGQLVRLFGTGFTL